MPPARGGTSDFTADSIEFAFKPSAVFDDDEDDDCVFSENTDLMDLDEFLSVHEGRAAEDEKGLSGGRHTSDLLSDLLQTVHKNLGIPRGSQPSAFKIPGDGFKGNSNNGSSKEKGDRYPLSDHEYVNKECKVEVESDEEENHEDEIEDTRKEVARQGKSKRRKSHTYRYNPKPVQKKSCRNFVPDSLKDIDYWEKRKRNNLAAKKSREDRRRKELEVLNKMANLEQQNADLMDQVKSLEEKNKILLKKLKDATSTKV
ncbi:transcription factor VBP-like isoform X2 [Rhopilema esculentum]|uniref:transcription factor VBP-like isoform X2 n=1 Tax=Rhopilema esculentum TaxID=499914 RepID=UPI0031E3AD2F